MIICARSPERDLSLTRRIKPKSLGGSHQDAASVLISVACLKMAKIGE